MVLSIYLTHLTQSSVLTTGLQGNSWEAEDVGINMLKEEYKYNKSIDSNFPL